MSYEIVKNYRQRLKKRATYVLGDKCQCCGYNKCISALEFHHIDPTQKDINFGSNTNRSWEVTRKELEKCILVCANCHREIHAGLIDNSKLESSFNEKRAVEVDNLVKNLKNHQVYLCPRCGKEISYKATYCLECSHIIQRKVSIRPERNELKQMIRTCTFVDIGKKYNVADNTIRKWCDDYNLPRRKKDINTYNDEDWDKL